MELMEELASHLSTLLGEDTTRDELDGEALQCLQVIEALAGQLLRAHDQDQQSGASATVSPACVSRELKESLDDAILDSGASQTYVTSKVTLDSPRAGTGYVRVANGKKEAIVEQGDLGPLTGARKVHSFSRTLVSVSDVAEQVGNVLFTPSAAFVLSTVGADKYAATQIATATKSRLYKFDVCALQRHVEMHGGCSTPESMKRGG